MNAFEVMLNSKYCKETGYYVKRIVTEDVNEENFFDYASPIKFGYVGINKNGEFLTPTIRTKATKLSIHLYGKRDFEVDDVFRIDDKFYKVESISIDIVTKGFNKGYHYFINLK